MNQIDKIQNELNRLQAELDKLKQPDYTHLLPEGYEFCEEEQAEDWVKVELDPNYKAEHQSPLGHLWTGIMDEILKPLYRPIRPIQYRVAVHEVVTTEPNPYAVDWSNAPEWADVHSFQDNGDGFWHGTELLHIGWRPKWQKSNFTLPSGLDWKQSKTRRP